MAEQKFVNYCRKCYYVYDTAVKVCQTCNLDTKLHGIKQLEIPTDVKLEFITAIKHQLLAHGAGTQAARKYASALVKWYLSKQVEDIKAADECLRYTLNMSIDFHANIMIFMSRFYGNYVYHFEKEYVNSRIKS